MGFIENRKYYRSVFFIGLLLLVLLIGIAVNFGVAEISLNETFRIMLSKIPFLNQFISVDKINHGAAIIILNLRLPRILLACLVGAGLAVAGVSFQSVFKNPMAEPYVLGISSGSALGAALTFTIGIENYFFSFGLTTASAFVGGILTSLLVYNLARIGSKVSNTTLLLSGIAINFFLTAIISLIMTFKRTQIEKIVMWTMGSVTTANWTEVAMLFSVVLFAIGALFIWARDLNLVLMGDETAKSLGVDVVKLKKYILGISTLLVSAIVAVSGVIGFVGLIVPHMVRIIFGSDHKVVIPFSALGGAGLLIVCDTIARTLVAPTEIPLGIITSLFGVPFFLFLIAKKKKKVFYE